MKTEESDDVWMRFEIALLQQDENLTTIVDGSIEPPGVCCRLDTGGAAGVLHTIKGTHDIGQLYRLKADSPDRPITLTRDGNIDLAEREFKLADAEDFIVLAFTGAKFVPWGVNHRKRSN